MQANIPPRERVKDLAVELGVANPTLYK